MSGFDFAYFQVSCCSLDQSVLDSFLQLNNVLLDGYTTLCLSVPPAGGRWGVCTVLVVRNIVAMNPDVEVFIWTCFQFSCICF